VSQVVTLDKDFLTELAGARVVRDDYQVIDTLLESGRTSCVQADRVKYYHKIQQVLAEEQPVVFLYFRDMLQAVSSRVHGIDPGPNGLRYNMPEWYVPKGQQRYTP
jgi:peptide/nickel transport system substrate-binding protein